MLGLRWYGFQIQIVRYRHCAQGVLENRSGVGGHFRQLTVQGALGWVVIHTLHAVFLKATDVDKQLSDVIGALAVKARHHVCNVRQLLRVKGAYPNLETAAVGFGCFNVQIRADLL